jgi:hypothetical protein
MFGGKGGKASLQEAPIEIGVVSDDKYHPAQQIVHGGIVGSDSV